jgi:hypothetical protein
LKSSPETINTGTTTLLEETPTVFAGKVGKELFLAHTLFALNRWDFTISMLQTYDDVRIIPMARGLIIKILDKETKIKLLKQFDSDIEAVRQAEERSQREKDLKVIEVCQNAISVVYEHLSETHALAKARVILPLTADPAPDEEDTNEYSLYPSDDD